MRFSVLIFWGHGIQEVTILFLTRWKWSLCLRLLLERFAQMKKHTLIHTTTRLSHEPFQDL
jgi:hypothetical protein